MTFVYFCVEVFWNLSRNCSMNECSNHTIFWCRIHQWFRWMGWSAGKVDDVTACRIQDGGYALLWQRYDNNNDGCYIVHLQQYSHRL